MSADPSTAELLLDKNGKPIPQYFNPTTGLFEAITGSGGASDNVLTGSNTTLRYIDASSSTTIPANGSEAIQITASTGKTARIIGMFLKAVSPIGSTTGSHNIEWAPKQLGFGSYGNNTFNNSVIWQYGYWYVASSTVFPSEHDALAIILSRIEFTDTIPFLVNYSNHTDVPQTQARSIQLLIEERV